MSINTSVWTQQNRSVYSTKTQSSVGQKVNRSISKHGLKQRKNIKQNMSQLGIGKHNISKQSMTSQQSKTQKPNQQSIMMQKLDMQFVSLLKQLQKYYIKLTKHEQIRVQKWIVKIIQNDETLRWKQNRNNYLRLLLHVVKNNECLLEPFDKIPDCDKDLPYLSQHEFNQRTKPRFDGKSPVFHLHKPQIIRINEPQGDSCSVLISIVNTARTVKDKENVVNQNIESNLHDDFIKQSQLIECNNRQFSKVNVKQNVDQIDNNEEISSQCKKLQNQYQLQVSSVIPSNLPSNNPSQVKSITPYSHSNKSPFSKKDKDVQNNQQVSIQKQKMQKYNNHQKYSIRNSIIMDSSNLMNKNSLRSSNLKGKNPGSMDQLKLYKELVLTMGKLLLKHEFTIQKQSEYWQFMRMIYSYQSSLKNSFNSTPKLNKQNKNLQNNWQSQRVGENGDTFEDFLSKLREEIGGNENKNQMNMEYTPQDENKDILLNRLDHSSLGLSQKEQKNRSNLANNGNNPKQPKTNKNFIYNDYQTINHITQQSLDFKVQQGVQQEHMLYYELDQKRKLSMNSNTNEHHLIGQNKHSHLIIDEKVSQLIECQLSPSQQQQYNNLNEQKLFSSQQQMNNSLMQISDSYREIRNNKNNNNRKNPHILQDYHNVYDQPEEEQEEQEDEISFTDKPLIDEDQQNQQDQAIMYGEYVNEEEYGELRNIQEDYLQEASPQFTEDEYDYQQEDQLEGHSQDQDETMYYIQDNPSHPTYSNQ